MNNKLRLLILEDRPADAELMLRELRRAGYEPEWKRVETEPDFLAQLDQGWEIILADYPLPQFDGLRALELLKERGLDIPFILVSATIGEDKAVAAMKAGASDSIMKDKLARLGPAIDRELRDAGERRKRRLAEKAVRRLATAVDQAAEMIMITDPAGTIQYVNPACERITGYTSAEALGQYPRLLKSGRQDAAFYRRLWQTITSGEVWSGHFTNRRKDGTFYEEECTISPVRNDQGRIAHFIAVKQDVTARVRAEEALAKSEAKYRALFESSRDALMTLFPPDWKFTSANAATVKLFGAKDEQEFTALGPREVSPEQQPDGELSSVKAKRMIETAMEQGSHFFDWVHQRISGEVFPATVLLTRVELEGKTGLQATVRDITEQKRAEEALRASEARFEAVMDHLGEWVWEMDAAGRFTYASVVSDKVLGYHPEEITGKLRFTDLISPNQQAEFSQRLAEQIAARQPFHQMELELVHKTGRRLRVEGSGNPILDAQGNLLGYRGAIQDLTEKKQLEAQFLRTQRMESIGTLASGVAHDLNNILAPILMGVSLLREGLLPKDAEDVLKLIETSAQRGTAVVKQVLTFGRGIAGERVLIQPRHLINEVLKMARGTFPKLITIASETPPDLWPLLGDATQLHQVLLNLCVNARDAMPKGGTLRLAAQNVRMTEDGAREKGGLKAGHYLLLQVSDTGHGIPPEIIVRIFDPFFTTKELGQGTGLGLSTVLGIVKSHGGFVGVRSEAGQGTTFEVYLPAASAPAALPRGQGELILVVDDEAGIRDVTRRILVKHGYTVVTASQGAEALTQYAQHRDAIRLVLSDLMMPVMDGLAMIRRLKKINPQVRIISSTGWGEENKIAALRELGLTQFLTKPFTIEQLLNALHELLSAVEPEPK